MKPRNHGVRPLAADLVIACTATLSANSLSEQVPSVALASSPQSGLAQPARASEPSAAVTPQPRAAPEAARATPAASDAEQKLKAAGFIEMRHRKGSHRLLVHPLTKKEAWVAIHTKKDAGQIGNRILRDAGIP